jgi:site-specific DNA recombinase
MTDLLALQRRNEGSSQGILGAAQEWSKRLASAVTGEMRPFIRSLISRIVIYTDRVDVLLDRQALRSALFGGGSPVSPRPDMRSGFLTLKLNACLKRCGREVRLVLPANSGEEMPVHPTQSLIKAVARAHDWYRRITRGELTGSRSIANATGLDERYVNRIFQFAFLAPDIVESILDGRQPAKMTLENFRTHLPIHWEAQRQRLGFPGDDSAHHKHVALPSSFLAKSIRR